MDGTIADSSGEKYACKCLNIRIRPTATETTATESIGDADFTSVFVGEGGIIVAHPQLTVRTRTRGTPIVGTGRYFRFTTITCLICNLLVYRVHQTYSTDVEARDGPLLPTEDWVERDILKSATGWIEVHVQCLTGSTLSEAISSPTYSRIFSLLLPPALPLPPPIEPIFERPPSPSLSPSSPPSPVAYLSNIRPLFLPPPYTPSHPVFTYLSSLADKESQAIRAAAEQSIAELIGAKTREIEQLDAELRSNVETVWQKFRENVNHVQQERSRASTSKESVLRSKGEFTNGLGSSSHGTPLAVRDFTPAAVSPARSPPPPSVPRMSALSASLVTSSVRPRTRESHTSPSPDRSQSVASYNSNESSNSGSSTLVLPPSENTNSNILKFRRSINDTINTEASFKYFVDLEEDMARYRHARQNEIQEKVDQNQQSGPSRLSGSPNTNDHKNQMEQLSETQAGAKDTSPHSQNRENEASTSRGREKTPKGKRKVVTFDIQPEVVTITREVNAEKEEEDVLANQDPREMIFELEDLEGEDSEQPLNSKPTLPLIEQSVPPSRTRKPRTQNTIGLPGSFSNLRPASLPAPSHIRPPRSQHGSDSSSTHAMLLSLNRPSLLGRQRPPSSPLSPAQTPEPTDSRDNKTQSHQDSWKPDRRKDILEEGEEEDDDDQLRFGVTEMARPIKRGRSYNRAIEGENDLTEDRTAFVGSLPIAIKPVKRPVTTLSLASYQPTAVISERPATKSSSSTAIRKASYAERDRSRSMDPGILDFTEEDEDDEDEDEEDRATGEDPSRADPAGGGGRGRKRALKILQARSAVPEAGMWRSLAS